MSTLAFIDARSHAAGSVIGDLFKAGQRIGGALEFGVSGAQWNQDAIHVQSAVGLLAKPRRSALDGRQRCS